MKPKSPKLSQLLWLVIGIGSFTQIHATEPDIHWLAGGHFIETASVDFLPDGRRLLSASADVEVKLWDLPSRRLLWASSEGNFGPSGTCVAPDGSFYLASARQQDTNLVIRTLSGDYPVTRVGSLQVSPRVKAISPSSQRAAAAGFDSPLGLINDLDLRVWDISGGKEISALPSELLSELGLVTHLEFITEDDLIIASVNRLTRWSVQGTVKWTHNVASSGNFRAYALTPDRRRLLVEEDRALKLLDTSTGEPVWTLTESVAGSWSARFDDAGSRFALAFSADPVSEGRIEIRATADGALLQTLPIPFSRPVAAFSPDGLRLACGHARGIHLITLLNAQTWEALTESSGSIRLVAASASQNWVVSSTGRQLDLRRLDTGERFRSLPQDVSLALAAAPDGSWLAFTTNSTRLARYRPATDQFDAPAVETGALSSLTASRDGRRLLAIPQGDEAFMIASDTWKVTARPKGSGPLLAAWAPDASRVTISFDGLARTYDLDTRDPRSTRDWGTDLIRFLEYLSDGETILSLHRSGQMRRWRVADGAILSEVNLGISSPTAVALSPDQRLLLIADQGEGIRILDATTGAEWDHWTRDTGYQINRLSFSDDANWLVSARLDGAVALMRAPFLLHSVRATASGLEFSISGGNGPYQVQNYPGANGGWSNVGTPFQGNTVNVVPEGPGPWLYRLVTPPGSR
ncbi:MAG: WD40 repeat domain-containing protein [Verrucomicrobiota bacterium]